WYRDVDSTEAAASPPLSNPRTMAAPRPPHTRQPVMVSFGVLSLRTGSRRGPLQAARLQTVRDPSNMPPHDAQSTASFEASLPDGSSRVASSSSVTSVPLSRRSHVRGLPGIWGPSVSTPESTFTVPDM